MSVADGNGKGWGGLVVKILLNLVGLVVLAATVYCAWDYLSRSTSAPIGEKTLITLPVKRNTSERGSLSVESAKMTDSGELAGVKEVVFPLQLKTTSKNGYSHIGHRQTVLRKANQPERQEVTLNFAVPDKVGTTLRLKLFRGESFQGSFQLIADLQAKVNASSTAMLPGPHFPPGTKIPEHIREMIARQQAFRQRSGGTAQSVSFQVTEKLYDCIYLRPVLCLADGTVLHQYNPIRLARPQLNRGGVMRSEGLSKVIYGQGEAIFLSCDNNQRQLMFRLTDPKSVVIEKLSVDGKTTRPILTASQKSRGLTRFSINLNYPFSARIILQFKYRQTDGSWRNESMSFLLPPPAPYLSARWDNDAVVLEWDDCGLWFQERDYVTKPAIVIEARTGIVGEFAVDGKVRSTRVVAAGQPGDFLNFRLSMRNGILKTTYWSRSEGLKTAEINLPWIIFPLQSQGVSVRIPDSVNKPLNVALLPTDICFENTGIPSTRLASALVTKLASQPEFHLIDWRTRDYVLREKMVTMSEPLRQFFAAQFPDVWVQLRDYSRQDGNGVELWVGFPDRSSGVKWFRIADLNNAEPDIEAKAVVAITNLVEAVFLRYGHPDTAKIKQHVQRMPERIVLMPLRPLNQPQVVTEAASIGETLMLQLLGDDGKIKIVSESDWRLAQEERLKNGSDGGYERIGSLAEIMIDGVVWKEKKDYAFCFLASDVLTGKILGVRSLNGSLEMVSPALKSWLEGLRAVTPETVSDGSRRGGLPGTPRLLTRYGKFVTFKDSLSVARSSAAGDVFALAATNWKDGYKDKAVALMEKEWQQKKSTNAGVLLAKYYGGTNQLSKALALCNVLMERDDCPESVVDCYNQFRRAEKTGGSETAAIVSPPKTEPKKVSVKESKDHIDHLGVKIKSYDSRGKLLESFDVLRNHYTRQDEEWEKDFFIDRQTIGAEWSPNSPCRTDLMVLRVDEEKLSDAVNNPAVMTNGVWIRTRLFACNKSCEEILPIYWYRADYYTPPPTVFGRDSEPRGKKLFRTFVIVTMAAWNSYDPFDETIPVPFRFTRLGYFFLNYNDGLGLLTNLYDGSRVRALLELEKKLELEMPEMFLFNAYEHTVQPSEIKTGADIFRCYVNDIRNGFNDNTDCMSLTHLIALEFMAKRGHARAQKLYRKVMAVEIPDQATNHDIYRLGEAFLVFRAGQKNQAAERALRLHLKNISRFNHDAADYAYYLAVRGNLPLAAQLLKCQGAAATMRWLPPARLKSFLMTHRDEMNKEDFYYLALGIQCRSAGFALLMESSFYQENFLTQLYGCPPAEAYRQWGQDYLKSRTRKMTNDE